jgi:hypothetical protein
VSPERVREVQQLWAVALHYLGKSEGLKYEPRKYKDLLAVFRKASVPERDLVVLARSADLDSAAIRLASLDERLRRSFAATAAMSSDGTTEAASPARDPFAVLPV